MSKLKKFFRKGNGELLGFVICMPIFTFLLVMIVSLTQIALAKETLEYTAYTSARSAVVAEGTDTVSYSYNAMSNANDIAKKIASENGYSSYKVEMIVDGNVVGRGDSSGVFMRNDIAWAKGLFITVRVTFQVDTMISWMSAERSSSIVMMVERPANTGGTTP